MAWSSTQSVPTYWFSGWSEDGADITLPLADVPELTAAEADAASGDIRYILFALCEQVADTWYGIDSADRPTTMTVSRSTSTDETAGTETKQYVMRFTTSVDVGARDVVDES